MPKKKPKSDRSREETVRKRRPRPPPPSTRGEPDESSDDSDDDKDLPDDAAELEEFIGAPPAIADHVVVVSMNPSGDAVVQDRTATECKRNAPLVAAQIYVACERWAKSEGRVCRFRATWMRGDKTVATLAWHMGENRGGGDGPELDGSVTSFLIQQQHAAQENHKLHLEGFEMIQEGWRNLLAVANKRNEALERDNQELRDRLRKLDDVGSELAIENARAEIEARTRTADLLEKRVLPIAQAVIAKQLEQSAAAASAVGGNGKDKHSE